MCADAVTPLLLPAVSDRSHAPHVSICVLTYQRPAMLARCLGALSLQVVEGFTCSILVVDNDADESAKLVVQEWVGQSKVRIDYAVEPVQSISLARNRAVRCSDGDYIAFIDDDEVAEPEWVATLLTNCRSLGVHGVLGPVLAQFEGSPPPWLIESGLCRRADFPTGTLLTSSRYMRTGNFLFSRDLVTGAHLPFNPKFGLSGGEDADFFERMLHLGRKFAWVNEARVHEWVPAERQTLGYHLRRGVIRGVMEADKHALLSAGTAKSLAAIAVYVAAMPFLVIFRFPLFARCAVSCCDHAAKLLAQCGIRLARKRTF